MTPNEKKEKLYMAMGLGGCILAFLNLFIAACLGEFDAALWTICLTCGLAVVFAIVSAAGSILKTKLLRDKIEGKKSW